MKQFDKIIIEFLFIVLLMFGITNFYVLSPKKSQEGKPWQVEIHRIAQQIERGGIDTVSLDDYTYVTDIRQFSDDEAFFEDTSESSCLLKIDDKIYRFDYHFSPDSVHNKFLFQVNLILAVLSVFLLGTLLFIRQKILKPFEILRDIPYELSRGNLTMPLQENKNHFFGRFIWGVDLLREHLEQQKQKELNLQRDKKTLLLSISHDIKTPLSAIKLYATALTKNLYKDGESHTRIAENINAKADEISEFVAQIITASSEDFLNLEVNEGEFYLSVLVSHISDYYKEKLDLIKIPFSIGTYTDYLVKGDPDRGIEVLQNILENALKYGDGHRIDIQFKEEEDCLLMTVTNSGCTLPDAELPHIFDSFWRGSNTGSKKGSGLGLYICRQLMHRMDGELFAEIKDGDMHVTAVFRKAG